MSEDEARGCAQAGLATLIGSSGNSQPSCKNRQAPLEQVLALLT